MHDDNRARILELAVAAIDAGGEEAIRVNHIVAEVGVTPPVLYYHFGSRDGLVIAAQVERYVRQAMTDLDAIGRAIAGCSSRDELRTVLIAAWTRTIAGRVESRWVRISAVGSAYARPELEAAITRSQDEFTARIVEFLEPCRDRGWLRPGIDLTAAVSWQHGLLLSRALVERGADGVDLDEWDRLTLEAIVGVFFGD